MSANDENMMRVKAGIESIRSLAELMRLADREDDPCKWFSLENMSPIVEGLALQIEESFYIYRQGLPSNEELLHELKAAHQVIKNGLALMTMDQKIEWGRLNAQDGVEGEGVPRANEGLAAIEEAEGVRS